jgi:tetratricopeptide (TPR) repeat protein
VVISASTKELIGARFEAVSIGQQTIKGFDQPLEAFRVIAETTYITRFDERRRYTLPLIGRDQELALLRERWQMASVGEGQGVLLMGDAGIGKSRLVRKLSGIAMATPCWLVTFQCSPYRSDSALWPAKQQLRHSAGIDASDTASTASEKIAALLAPATASADELAWLVQELLEFQNGPSPADIAPAVHRNRTLQTLVRLLRLMALEKPLLMVVEDLHWVDPTTLELLEMLLGSAKEIPILLVFTSRPYPIPEIAAVGRLTHLSLSRLGRTSVMEIVAHLGGSGLAEGTQARIIAETDGNPLFVEEMTKTVLELGETGVPPTLYGYLMARLDRAPELKSVAQFAACIGREFDDTLLTQVSELNQEQVATALEKLVSGDIVLPPEADGPKQYAFKHALLRDAAYESLLISNRREIHGRIAGALEGGAALDQHPEWLAHHHEMAGHIDEAIRSWTAAGKTERRRSANHEAAAHFNRALKLAQTESSDQSPAGKLQLVELHTELGAELIATKGNASDEVVENYRAVYDLCQDMPNSKELMRVLHGMRTYYLVRGPVGMAYDLGERVLDIAEQLGDLDLLIQAYRSHGLCLFAMGRLPEALDLLAKAVAVYEDGRSAAQSYMFPSDPLVLAKCALGWCSAFTSDAESAAKETDDAVERARALKHAHSEAFAVSLQASTYAALGDFAKVEALPGPLAAFSQANGFPYWQAWATALLCWAQVNGASPRRGIADNRERHRRL